jgi:CRP/FNR family transcriptional regulator, cyclic AMP receptor protein
VARKSKISFDPKKFLAKVGDGTSITRYQPDQIVFSQGDPADAVFYIQKGKLKLTVISEQGKEAVIAILGPGHFFGEGCLNGHGLRVATTSAMVLLANFGKEARPEPIVGKISQETLAEMIGTTRARVSHFMNKFRKLGYIDYNGPGADPRSAPLPGVRAGDAQATGKSGECRLGQGAGLALPPTCVVNKRRRLQQA